MTTLESERQESTVCPTCGRDDFESYHGVRIHHGCAHGESLDRYEVDCEWCGATLERPRSQIEDYDRQFCDENCQGEWRSENRTGSEAFNWRSDTVECEVCGGEFDVPPSRQEKNGDRFCGMECYAEWYSESKTGDAHPRWRGGYKDYYGPDWAEQRRRARDRDDYTCQACGLHEDDAETELSVHHIRPFRFFDSHEPANELDNLTTLCRECHAKWEGIPLRPEVVVDE